MSDVFRDFRARPDERHIAYEHIPKLGEFVEFGFAEEMASAGDSGVAVAEGELAAGFGGGPHGAEFQQAKRLSVFAHPCLLEEHPAARIKRNPKGQTCEQRRQEKQTNGACSEVKRALGEGLRGFGGLR